MNRYMLNFLTCSLGISLLTVGACADQAGDNTGGVRTAPSRRYTMAEFMKTISISGESFNHADTRLLVSSNETGVFNVYELDLATNKHTSVTEGDDTTFGVSYMPTDDRILFTRDQGGNENSHLFLRDLNGAVHELTDGEKTKEMFWGFNNDLKTFFTTNNERDAHFFDLYQWNATTLDKHLLYRNESGMQPAAISPDSRWLVLDKPNTTNDSDLYVLDLQSGGEPELISAHEGDASFSAQTVDADSRYLYYTSTDGTEFARLCRYEFATGLHEDVYTSDWDVVFTYFSRRGTYRVIGTNEDGYTKVKITRNGRDLVVDGLPAGTISAVAFSNSEKFMKLTVSSDIMPGNIFIVNLANADVRQVTQTINPDIDPGDLVASEVTRFPARDGLVIPGPLYKPIGAGPKNKVPVMLWIHGGPGGQSRAGYSAEKQFLLNNGYALFAVNNRGSSGYGKAFLAADDGKHGREPLWDCVDAKKYLQTLDWVDSDRIGIMGGSYGGYMTLAALAFEPEEFVCGVDIFGVANWIATLENIPPYWESFRQALYTEIGNPETDRDFLRLTSPVFHGDKITRPLMVLQGANDPRVPQAESDGMVAAITANGGTVEYVVFADEGHGFRKSDNRITGFNRILAFLDTYLKSAPNPGRD